MVLVVEADTEDLSGIGNHGSTTLRLRIDSGAAGHRLRFRQSIARNQRFQVGVSASQTSAEIEHAPVIDNAVSGFAFQQERTESHLFLEQPLQR